MTEKECETCLGTGYEECPTCGIENHMTCTECNGTGTTEEDDNEIKDELDY